MTGAVPAVGRSAPQRLPAETATGPPSNAPSVTVVICAYTERRWDDLVAAVRSVRAQRWPRADVVLVVDHNPDLLARCRTTFTAGFGGLAVLGSDPCPVLVVASFGRPGLSGARNTGVAHASGDVVAFLDDDARAAPGWLAALTAPYADPRVQGVGGAVVPAWTEPRPSWFPPEFDWVVGCSYVGMPETAAEIRNPIGAAMSVRHRAFDLAGDFSDGIGRIGATPLGCEETEFFIRLRHADPQARVVYAPTAVVHHTVGGERGRWSYFRRRCYAEGLSKARVAGRVGTGPALAAERAYVRDVLPRAVLRDLAPGGRPGRAAAVLAGLTATTAGYVRGRAAAASQRRKVSTPTTPTTPAVPAVPAVPAFAVWCGLVDVDLDRNQRLVRDGDGTLAVPAASVTATPYQRARLLIRRSGDPLGFVTVGVTDGCVDGVALNRAAARLVALAAVGDQATAPPGSPVSPGPPVSVTVVVCTRDRAQRLRGCLEALRECRYPMLDVIVVDNAASDDSTRQMFDAVVGADPRFRYVPEPRPGLSRARNRGLAEATGDVVAFTDDDVRVDSRWVDGLARGFGRRADVACVTGLVVARELDGPVQAYFDAKVSWSTSCTPRVFDLRSGASQPATLYPFTAGLFGTGANFAFRTEVLRELAGFDEALGAGTPTGGGEDLDAFVRVLLAGHALAYEPAALVWHSHRADLGQLRQQMFNYGSGLSAYLTKYLLADSTRRRLMAAVPAGVAHLRALSDRAALADGVAEDSPSLARGLRLRELAGLAAGPALLLRSRLQVRSHRAAEGSAP